MVVSERPAARITDRRLVPLAVAVALAAPGVVLELAGIELRPSMSVVVFAATFIGAALLLTWGTELAQLDLPPGLAVSILALVAILPEYAVDLLFAYEAGSDPSKAPLALANMTGANRLLIGIGWSLIVLVAALGARRARRGPSPGQPAGGEGYAMSLGRLASIDVVVLGAVSLYTLTFIFRRSLTLIDSLLLLGVFGFYVYRLWTSPKEEPEFIGPPAVVSQLPVRSRRTVTLVLMAAAAAAILLVAEPFSSSLVEAGTELGVDQFLLVQWVAPLATESAELIPAAIFAYRQQVDEGLGTLLSSKINQWTLLVGAVPIAFAASTIGLGGLPIDGTQRVELFLTAAQSLFAVSLLVNLSLSVREAIVILTLFLADFAASVLLPGDVRGPVQLGFSGLYLVLALVRITASRRQLPALLRDGAVRPPRELAEAD